MSIELNPNHTKTIMEKIKRDKRAMRLSAVIAAQDMWANPDGFQRGVRTSEISDFISFSNDIYKFIANGTLKKEK